MDDAWAVPARVTGDDDETLAHAASADARAFGVIYERHRTLVFRYLRSRTASDDEAAELAAVTFERALGAIGRFRRSGGGMRAWLLRIARNAHTDAVRRQSVRRAEDELAADETTASSGAVDDAVILRSLVEALPPVQREAIQLRFAGGLTAREIGAVLGITEAAAQKQIERALGALKEAYGVD